MYRSQMAAFLKQFCAELHRETQRLQAQTMPSLTEALFVDFEQTGSRRAYEHIYFTRRRFLLAFGLQALVEKQHTGRASIPILGKLAQIITEICRETCWALPAHVNRKSPGWQLTIDLFAAETAQTLSELTDRLRTELPVPVLEQVRQTVEARVLIPFLACRQYGWEKADHNWNAVCTSCIGSACIHLRGACARTDQCLNRFVDSLAYYIRGFAADGTCIEGVGYYTYGMAYFVNFARELYTYTGGKTDLLCGPWPGLSVEEMGRRAYIAVFQSACFFADGRSVSFSDGNSCDKFCMGLLLALQERFPQVELPPLECAADLWHDHNFRFVPRRLDFEMVQAYLSSACDTTAPAPRDLCLLPDAQWCIARSCTGMELACKGGHNGEPHNHKDVGHFIYEGHGILFLTDLGAGEYTRDYFNENRYTVLCTDTRGHSVPILDGKGQLSGSAARCTTFTASRQQNAVQVEMELSAAYGRPRGTLHRQLTLLLDTGALYVTDRVAAGPDRPVSVRENLVTQICPQLQASGILLERDGHRVLLQFAAGIPQDICIEPLTHQNHRGQPETVYAIQWTLPANQTHCLFSLCPSNDHW